MNTVTHETIFQEFNTPKWYDSLYRKLLSNMVQIITPIAVACRSDAASHSSWLSHCFWLLTFPPHRPYLLSFRSPWAVWCMAPLKRLFLPRVVLISNKRGCGTRGGGEASWHCYSLFFPLQRITWPRASSLSPPLVFLSLFFYPHRSQSRAP